MHYKELKQVWAELTAPGAPFEVEAITVRNTPMLAYKNAPNNLRDIWRSTAAFGDADYLIYRDERITYRQAHALCDNIAGWLCAHGVRPGGRVAIAMRNYPEWLLIYWACVSMGVTVVGMNAWWSAEEIAHAFQDSKPTVAFADEERLARILASSLPVQTNRLVAVRAQSTPGPNITSWAEVASCRERPAAAHIDPDADACIFYTSGTSGPAKGAQITHRSSVCNIYNVLFAGQSQSLATMRARRVSPEDAPSPVPPVALLTTPLFHVTANNCGAHIATILGGAIVLMYRWDPGEALRLIEKERVTTMSGVPMMGRELISHPDFSRTDTSSLLSIGGGGAPLQPDLVERIEKAAPGLRAASGYGMTEASGVIASIAGDFFVDKPTSCGPVLPAFDAVIVNDDGRPLPLGNVGELRLKGASVINGYLNEPEATAATITNGWLHTGDLARIDEDGFLHIVDRKKDMVLRGGENVFCAEVEAVLHRHPDVAECCVFAVADERLGEAVGAAVVLREGGRLGEEELRTHCAGHLARFKIPEHVWFLTEKIPRNASGKFVKNQLRQTLGAAAPR